ncbi:RNA polymerase sigma-I factor [Vallitalea pronyensis]|uniref:RNA polymerase sigma factor SigI n=1 Tax=Vallitalea pronyensis TaxID=1348613 RepID=A0A8J8MGG6_9FIRM|nr:RNA polymerase sigma-I factor [Vallitalea pronyensis]QUI21200.1 RNA polymerase sigma-I factor [Vallitalea pronyensis]
MEHNKSLDESVMLAKKNIHIRNELIEQYKPFIASTVQQKIGRYVAYGRDEELSIALMAFNEAIDSYDTSKGSFLSFGKLVISRRLIDYARKKHHEDGEILLEKQDMPTAIDVYNQKSIEAYNMKSQNELRQLEIIQYQEELKRWGIDFEQLVRHSPKHKKTRRLYKDIAAYVTLDSTLMTYIHHHKRLPIQKIVEKMKVHRKKVERGRIYIIALIIIQVGDYQLLKEYI